MSSKVGGIARAPVWGANLSCNYVMWNLSNDENLRISSNLDQLF